MASDGGRECRFSGGVAAVASDGGRECRFSGARRDHGCGVANANFPFPVRWPAMWGREEKLSRWPTKGGRSECRFSGVPGVHRCGVVNADLVVSAVTMDVG